MALAGITNTVAQLGVGDRIDVHVLQHKALLLSAPLIYVYADRFSYLKFNR